jgi:Carboxypeptidase regulatory-like domain/TonB dependent receptor-like, beta-barrel/TonB-dependent Receptor Plug Domain
MLRSRAVLTLMLTVTCATFAAAQQSTTGSIAGRVIDSQNLPVPGATVTVISPQGTQNFVTDSDGRFLAPFLIPGQYEVKVELTGFRPIDRTNIPVRLGQRVALTLPMQVGALTETVEVRSEPLVIDTSTTTTGAVLESDMLARVPVGRRVSDALYLAPGVSNSGQVGQANPSIAGGSGLENSYVIDGVNITNAGFGALGSYSIIFGSLGSGVPFDFIKEAQVKTGGYEAQFGQASGGLVNVITKSGSNQFEGNVFGYFRPENLESTYDTVTTTNGTVNITGTRQNDTGVSAGGPIVRNRLFFFGAIDPQWERTLFVAPEGFPLQSLGEVPRDRRTVPYAAKATWQIKPQQHFDASFFGDPSHGANGPQRYDALLRNDTAGFSTLDQYGGHNMTFKYEGAFGSRWLLEGALARADNNIVEVPSVNAWSVTDTTVTPQQHSGGVGFYEVGNQGVNWQYSATATNLLGHHEIRYGVNVDDVDYTNTFNRTGPSFTLPNGAKTVTGAEIQILADPQLGQIYRVVRANTGNVHDTTQLYTAFFVQDSWRLGSHLTINPGLRYDHQRLTGTLEEMTLGNEWAPRLGATWDPTGTDRMKVFGSWGRFYARIPNDLAARSLSTDAGVSRADYFDANLTQPIPDGTLAAGTTAHFLQQGVSPDQIDPNVKAMYVNEAIAGIEYALAGGMSIGARYIHRDIPRVLEDVQPFPIVAFDLGLPGTESVNYVLTNPGPNTAVAGDLGASFETPIHRYNALEFTADKRFANRWALLASYRYSRLRGTYEGFFRDDNGQSDPGITSLFDFPTNDPSYTRIGVPEFGYSGDVRFLGALGEGPLPLDRPHEVKVYGNYQFPMGLNVGVGFLAMSGKPLTALAANPVYDSPGEIPTTSRGAGLQTIDGFLTRTPSEYDTNVHADYSLKLSDRHRIVLLADVFNLFNRQIPLDYDPNTETTFLAANPDLGQPSRFNLEQLETPRQVRIGFRYEF